MSDPKPGDDTRSTTRGGWPAWLLVRDEDRVVAIFHNTQDGRRDTASLLGRLLTTGTQEHDRPDAAATPRPGSDRESRVWVERVDMSSDDPWGDDSSPTSRRLVPPTEHRALTELGVPRDRLDPDDRWVEPLPPHARLDLVTVGEHQLQCECGRQWIPTSMSVAAICDSTRRHLFTDCPQQRRYEHRHRWTRFGLTCPACSHALRWHYPDTRLPGHPVLCAEPVGQGNTCACDGTGSRTIDLFDRAARLMGTQVAVDWFTGTNDHLEGARPIDILRIHGPARIDEALDAHEQR